MRRVSLFALLLATGCPQPVQVLDGGAGAGDGGAPRDAGAAQDAGAGADAGGAQDAGAGDAGAERCAGLPFCLTLTPDKTRVDVGEPVTVAAALDNPEGRDVTLGFCAPAPTTERRPGRPALVLSDIEWAADLDPTTGGFTFVVRVVPPYFLATTFHLEVCAYEGGSATPTARAQADLHVRGNVLFSAEYQGVFAVTSGGQPARGVGQAYPRGLLIDATVNRAAGLRLARDGTLLVYDDAANPARLHRFALDATEHRLSTFAFSADDLLTDPIAYDNIGIHQVTELPDGAVAVADSHLSGTPNPRVMIWNADGSFRREVRGGQTQHSWQAMTVGPDGDWLVGMQDNLTNLVLRLDPATGLERPDSPFSGTLPGTIWALEPTPDGQILVVGQRMVTFVGPGGAARAVTDIPGQASRDWVAATVFDDRIVVANDHQGDSENLAVLKDGRFERWLRVEGSGGPVIVPYGVAYLE
jgi:hypothetical protein